MPKHDSTVISNLEDFYLIEVFVPLCPLNWVVTRLQDVAQWQALVEVVVHPDDWVLIVQLTPFLLINTLRIL